jgi:hypothetical protein
MYVIEKGPTSQDYIDALYLLGAVFLVLIILGNVLPKPLE